MGRVGSRSIIKQLGKRQHSIIDGVGYSNDCHTLDVGTNVDGYIIPASRDSQEKIIKQFKEWINHKSTKILVPIREPIARCISSYFHFKSIYPTKNIRDLNLLKSYFLNDFNHDWTLNWFDNEIKKYCGIDVYNYQFDYSDGCVRIDNGVKDIIIIKSSKIKSNLKRLVFKYWKIQVGNPQVINQNKDLYLRFISEIRFPTWYVDKMYQSKYAQHFFKDELQDLRIRWSEK